MSHREAKPKTSEQLRMEAFYDKQLAQYGMSVGWGFDKHSEYLASYARDAWAAWQAAQSQLIETLQNPQHGLWIEFSDNGNVRFFTLDHVRAQAEIAGGRELQRYYSATAEVATHG